MGRVYDPSEVEAAPAPAGPRVYDPSEVELAPKVGGGEAFGHGVVSGGTFGFNKAIAGAGNVLLDSDAGRWLRRHVGLWDPGEVPVATTKEGKPLAPPPAEERRGALDRYRAGRNAATEREDQAAHDQTLAYLGGNVVGSVLSPVAKFLPGARLGKAAAKAAKLGPAAARIVTAGTTAAVEGAAYGVGNSKADLTQGDVGGLLRDTGEGALISGALGLGGGLLGEGTRALANRRGNALPKKILNEIAEGQNDVKTSSTQMKRLERAEENIVEEVVASKAADDLRGARATGDKARAAAAEGRLADADQVRNAYLGEAKPGIAKLQPKIDKIGGKLDDAYATFEGAGKAEIDPADMYLRLMQESEEAARKGKKSLAQQLEGLANDWEANVAKANNGGKADIRMARGFTTDIQANAVSSLGGLNMHLPAKIKNQLAGAVSKHLADILETQAAKDPALAKALAQIRENNPRMNALLTIRGALEQRAAKEQTRSALREVAKAGAGAAAVAGGVATLSGGDIGDKAQAAAIPALVGLALPKAFRAGAGAIERGLTSAGIAAQRSGVPAAALGGRTQGAGRALVALILGARRGADTAELEQQARVAGVNEAQISRAVGRPPVESAAP